MVRSFRPALGLLLGLLAGCTGQCQHEEALEVEASLLRAGQDVKVAKTLIDAGTFRDPGKLTGKARLAFTQLVASAPQEFLGLYCKLGKGSCEGRAGPLHEMVQVMGFQGPAAARREFNAMWGALVGGLMNEASQKVKEAEVQYRATVLAAGKQPLTEGARLAAEDARDDLLGEGHMLAQNAGELFRIYADAGGWNEGSCDAGEETFEPLEHMLLGARLGIVTGFEWKLPAAGTNRPLGEGSLGQGFSLFKAAEELVGAAEIASDKEYLRGDCASPAGLFDIVDMFSIVVRESRAQGLAIGISGIDADPNTPGLQTSERTDKQVWEGDVGHWFKAGVLHLKLQR